MGRRLSSTRRAKPRAAERGDTPAPGAEATPWATALPAFAFMGALGLIVLALTPFTYNLDDIKMPMFLVLGAMLAVLCLLAMASGAMPVPPRLVALGLGAYAAVLVISTLTSEFRWTGSKHLMFFLGSVGFFFGGMAAGATKHNARRFLVFCAVMLFAVNTFGFFQYDLIGSGETGMSWLYDKLYSYDPQVTRPTPMRQLLWTFSTDTRNRLMSTILNRDFYSAFCLLYLPLAGALALLSRNWIWRATAILAVLFSLVSVFLCQSKWEYFFAVAEIAFFIALYVFAIRKTEVRGGYLAAWGGGMAMLLGALLWMNLPSLLDRLKSLSYSVDSRSVIFSGALRIFADYPILGSGPGSFRVVFPRYRSDNYFEYEISNLTIFAHNYILDILSETGTLGALAFGLFALSLGYMAFRRAFTTPDARLRLMIAACLCALLGMYGSNMTSPNARWPIGAVGLWGIMGFMAGLVLQAGGWRPKARADRSRGRADLIASLRSRPIPLALAVVCLIGVFVNLVEGIAYWRGAKSYNIGKQIFELNAKEARLIVTGQSDATEAERAILTGRFESAAESFRRAVEHYPAHLSAYYQRGSVENMLADLTPGGDTENYKQQFLKALESYQGLQAYAPDYAELHYNFGIIYYRLGNILEREAAQLAPDRTEERARLRNQIETYNALYREYFERMEQMSRKAEVLLRLGEVYYGQGDYALAQQIFDKASRAYPDNWNIAMWYYNSSSRLGDKRAEIEARKRLYLLRPGQVDLLYGSENAALDLALESGFDDLFEEILELALERNPVDPELYERRSRYKLGKGRRAEALADAVIYAKLQGDDAELLAVGRDLAREAGDERASALIDEALRRLQGETN